MSVKLIVWERDDHRCVICKEPGNPWCHFIPRSQGGLGIEENIVTLCNRCHEEMDNGKNGQTYRAIVETYLREQYTDWSKEKLIYSKW